MARAKVSGEWDMVSAICADVRNYGFKGKRVWSAAELHPLRKQKPAKGLAKAAGARLLDSVFGVTPQQPTKPARPIEASRVDEIKSRPRRRSA